MKNFNKKTSNFFYDLLTEEMENICNVQNDADVIGLKIRNAIKTTKSIPVNMVENLISTINFYNSKVSLILLVISGNAICS